MTLSTVTKARLRLAAITIALVPVALLARMVSHGKLTEFVQRGWATAWKHYDAVRDAAPPD